MIHSYSYTPELNFHNANHEYANRLFFGFELEIYGDYYRYCANAIENFDNNEKYFWLTKDASIAGCGFEVKNQPMSYKFITETNYVKKLFFIINEHNMEVDGSCGLHFHISRDGLSRETIRNIDYLIHTHQDIFEQVCGRKYNYYCQSKVKGYYDWGLGCWSDHKHCVNLTNENTIEIRIFSSTVSYIVFMERLKLVKNIIDFCKEDGFSKFCSISKEDICKGLNLENIKL